jgi:Flp pilus assembly pilin Flp
MAEMGRASLERRPWLGERSAVIQELRCFWEDEAGPELVEWAVVTIVLLAATAVVLMQVGDALKASFQDILNELTK